jgi:CheY-like chemotaxis protein
MPPHQLAHITEPFFNTRTGRTGLGLPSVHGFAAQSGGALRLESRVGEGTTATIWLPAADPPAPRRITPMRPSARSHVVVCDDDDMVRDVIALILRNAGYVPHAFQDADAALAALENGTPCDLLVTDVLMPGPTGPELAATLRTRDPELPVLFISGYTEDAIDEQLPGMLLHKPFRSDQLVRAVRAAFERVDTSD